MTPDDLEALGILPRRRGPAATLALALAVALAFAVAALVAWGARGTPPPRRPRPVHDWLFVYVMAYDNDLDACTPVITSALVRGVRSDRVAVALLSDRVARDGLRRTLVTRRGVREERLPTEDMADPRALEGFLDWAADVAPARRHVLVFLDHGGSLDQMGYDARPRALEPAPEPGHGRWVSARATGEALRAWRRRRGVDDVPLVFLQQCGRASIENLLNFRGTGDAVLASQRSVGACNTYYEALLSFAASRPGASARDLAATIMDTDAHYATYALIDARALDELPRRADALVAALLDGAAQPPGREAIASVRPCFAHGFEFNYDLVQVARAVAATRGAAAVREAEAFASWVASRLVVEHRRREGVPGADAWCGVSTVVPALAPLLDLYRLQPAYRETRWGELTRALATVPLPLAVRPRVDAGRP